VEFLLLMPILVVTLLVLFQLILLLQAGLVVQHAAKVAARSAAVALPTTLYDRVTGRTEGSGEVRVEDAESPKVKLAHRAAAFVLATISPKSNAALAAAAPVLEGSIVSTGMSADLASRYSYASRDENTRVLLTLDRDIAQGKGVHRDVAVVRASVTFRYPLVVPFANLLLGATRNDSTNHDARFVRELTATYGLPTDLSPVMPESLKPGNHFETQVLE